MTLLRAICDMFNSLMFLLSVITIITALASAFFTWKNKPRKIFVCAFTTAILSFFLLLAQQYQSHQNDQLSAKLLEISKASFEYVSGGEKNKPLVIASFNKNSDGGFDVFFHLYNFGSAPLHGLCYEITDQYSIYAQYVREKGFKKLSDGDAMDVNLYAAKRSSDTYIQGEVINLPSNASKRIHKGEIPPGMPAAMYQITMMWNNEIYVAIYQYSYKKEADGMQLYAVHITDKKGKMVSDLTDFFSTVPSSVFDGFDTKVKEPRIYQFDANSM